MSYIAYPTEVGKEKLFEDLNTISNCEAQAALNEDILILVTDTKTTEEEELLQKSLKEVKSLSCLSLVYAENSEQSLKNISPTDIQDKN